MLKKAASFVLASLPSSTCLEAVRLGCSLAAASPDNLIEHPGRRLTAIPSQHPFNHKARVLEFFNALDARHN
jgi:hypothetical protein